LDIDLVAKLVGFVVWQEGGPLSALQLFGIATAEWVLMGYS
jgi:hypothetical protein